MRKFVQRIFSYALVALVLFIFISTTLRHYFPGSLKHLLGQEWLETELVIKASKANISSDTLYLGCSIGAQIIPPNLKNKLTTIGSVYPAGNYFLIKNAIEKNTHIKDVVYLISPFSIGLTMSDARTHTYFVKPFYTFKNLSEIKESERTMEILNRNKLLQLNLIDFFKLISVNHYNYSTELEANNYQTYMDLSEESIYWLDRINNLCVSNEINFHLISPPIGQQYKSKTFNWKKMREKIKDEEIEPLFLDYLSSITYMDDQYLKADGMHWQDEFIKSKRDSILLELAKKRQ